MGGEGALSTGHTVYKGGGGIFNELKLRLNCRRAKFVHTFTERGVDQLAWRLEMSNFNKNIIFHAHLLIRTVEIQPSVILSKGSNNWNLNTTQSQCPICLSILYLHWKESILKKSKSHFNFTYFCII